MVGELLAGPGVERLKPPGEVRVLAHPVFILARVGLRKLPHHDVEKSQRVHLPFGPHRVSPFHEERAQPDVQQF